MTTITTKGIPVPEPTDPNDLVTIVGAVSSWVDKHPGIEAMTTAQRDALTGAALWPGRTIFNTTAARLEVNATSTSGAAAWRPTHGVSAPWVAPSPGAHTWTKPAGATRIRVVLIGAGGTAGSAPNSPGGGGGALVDVTLPASMFAATVSVTVGAASSSASAQGGSSFISGAGNPSLTAQGGYGGAHATQPGVGGRVVSNAGVELGHLAHLGGPGGTSYRYDPAREATTGRGAGAGSTAASTTAAAATRGAGVVAGVGDVLAGLPGGGAGGEWGSPGNAPGGGGSGGGSTGGAGAPGAAAIIAYFD